MGREPLREIRIGMIGCGVVGQGLLELLARQKDALADRYQVRMPVTRLAVRDPHKDRGAHAHGIARARDALALVSDPEVDVIVEVAGGVGLDHVLRAALAAGKPVVTANKALLAQELAALGAPKRRSLARPLRRRRSPSFAI